MHETRADYFAARMKGCHTQIEISLAQLDATHVKCDLFSYLDDVVGWRRYRTHTRRFASPTAIAGGDRSVYPISRKTQTVIK